VTNTSLQDLGCVIQFLFFLFSFLSLFPLFFFFFGLRREMDMADKRPVLLGLRQGVQPLPSLPPFPSPFSSFLATTFDSREDLRPAVRKSLLSFFSSFPLFPFFFALQRGAWGPIDTVGRRGFSSLFLPPFLFLFLPIGTVTRRTGRDNPTTTVSLLLSPPPFPPFFLNQCMVDRFGQSGILFPPPPFLSPFFFFPTEQGKWNIDGLNLYLRTYPCPPFFISFSLPFLPFSVCQRRHFTFLPFLSSFLERRRDIRNRLS